MGKIQGEELENDETMFTMVLVAVRRGGAWGFVLRLSVIVVLLVITNQISRQVSLQVGSPALRHESLHSSPWMVETLERRAKLLELEFGDRTPMPTAPKVHSTGVEDLIESSVSPDTVSHGTFSRGTETGRSTFGVILALTHSIPMHNKAPPLCDLLGGIASWAIDVSIPVIIYAFQQPTAMTADAALLQCAPIAGISVEVVDVSLINQVCPQDGLSDIIFSTCAFISSLMHSRFERTLWLNTSSGSCLPSIVDLLEHGTGASSIAANASTVASARRHEVLWGHSIAAAPSKRMDLTRLDYFFARTASDPVQHWLRSFKDIYLSHSLRKAFPLIDPYFAFEVARMKYRNVKLHPLHRRKDCAYCARRKEDEMNMLSRLQKLGRDVKRTLRQGNRLPSLIMSTSMLGADLSSAWRLCPVKRGCRDNWPDSRYEAFRDHRAARAQFLSRKYKVVVVTGSSIEMLENLNTRLMLANKQAYSEAHGYGFEVGLSNLVVATEGLRPTISSHQKFRGEFVKTLIVFSAMRRYPDADWFLLADHDVWFNPLAMRDTSLDMFLDGIPADKHFAHANYHSMNTGVVLIRQSQEAHELVMKWWAIGNSGLIQCHSWDQAAAQLLLLHQLDGERSASPFNFTCLLPNCGNYQRSEYWSCDKGFTDALIAAFGNDTAARNYQKGLLRPGPTVTGHPRTIFHVLAESPLRPRLQCMDCRNISRLTLKGANYPVNFRGVDGWFTTHKGFALFRQLFRPAPKGQQTSRTTTVEMGRLSLFNTGLFSSASAHA